MGLKYFVKSSETTKKYFKKYYELDHIDARHYYYLTIIIIATTTFGILVFYAHRSNSTNYILIINSIKFFIIF